MHFLTHLGDLLSCDHSRTGRRIKLFVMMTLNDLDIRKIFRRLTGQLDHQYRAQSKIRSDQNTSIISFRQLVQLCQISLAEPGRTNHCTYTSCQHRPQRTHHHIRTGKINNYIRLYYHQLCFKISSHCHLITVFNRDHFISAKSIDCGNKLHILLFQHSFYDFTAHAAQSAIY